MVDPAENHLTELKSIIYSELKSKSERLPINDSDFELSSEQRVNFQVELNNNESIKNLLTMTPPLYRASKEGIEKAEKLQSLAITADAWIRIFRVST